MGYRPRYKEGYFPAPPMDSLQDLRSEAVLRMMQTGIDIEVHHHEVATAGQGEIDMRFQSMVKMADQVILYKYILKNVALKHHKTVTFMPKPLFGDNGSGMHVHISLWKKGANLFYDPEGYAQLSLMDVDIYELPSEEIARIKTVPGSLGESLRALEMDNEFLRQGDVFTTDLIETWIDYKRRREIDPVRLRPHSYEFYLYFDV